MITTVRNIWIQRRLFFSINLIVLFTIISASCGSDDSYARSFNSNDWKSDIETRYELVDDLINRKLIDQKSKNEIFELLGNPETNDPISDDDLKVNGHYTHFPDTTGTSVDVVYHLGTRPGKLQEVKYLFIWFESDTVSRYIIRGTYS